MSRSASLGMPQSVPTRSSSFSNDHSFKPGSGYNSFRSSVFASTFEDDESEVFSDDTGQYNFNSFQEFPRYRRPYSPDTNRSRSQSLAGLRTPQRRGLGYAIPEPSGVPQSWKETNPYLSDVWRRPSSHLKASEYLSYPRRVGSQGHTSLSAMSPLRSTGFPQEMADISNISPFLRDVNQIFPDEGNFAEPWGIGTAPGDEGWNPGSGTTSRRHSVSVVQPRRGALGLSSPEFEHEDLGFASRVPLSIRSGEDLEMTRGMKTLKLSSPDSSTIQEPRNIPPTSPIPVNVTHLTLEGDDRLSGRTLKLIQEVPSEQTRFADDVDAHRMEHDLRSPRSPQSSTSSHFRRSHVDPSAAPAGQNTLAELGKGVPLRSIPSSCPLYIVEFKAGRTDLFYSMDPSISITVGDFVIVEADRGRDLGKVVNNTITAPEVEDWQQNAPQFPGDGASALSESPPGKQLNPKRVYGKATSRDAQLLATKTQDEEKALQLCQSKVLQKRLPMEVVDAEYQWDRRKLTFYFIAEKRIDFRELVRELFRLYKTRIWMASLSQAAPSEG